MDTPPAASTHWDAGETLADRFRAHAADAEHLYGYAIRGMAEDWEAGGPSQLLQADPSRAIGALTPVGMRRLPAESYASSPYQRSDGVVHLR